MENLKEIIAEWRTIEPQHVAVTDVCIDVALQPRPSACVAFSQVNAEDRRSEDHIRLMTTRLMDSSVEIEPILAIRSDAALILFDGHHRLEACRRARRKLIPARVASIDIRTAVLASKLVNFGGEKLGLHPDQRRDAAWQVMSHLTDRGRAGLPDGVTQRTLAKQFGISLGNVNTMLGRLREGAIEPSQYQSEHCDPGTAWPRWPYARNRRYGAAWTPPTDDQRRKALATKLARTIAEAADKTDVGILREALGQLIAFGWDADAIEDAQLTVTEFGPEEESDY